MDSEIKEKDLIIRMLHALLHGVTIFVWLTNARFLEAIEIADSRNITSHIYSERAQNVSHEAIVHYSLMTFLAKICSIKKHITICYRRIEWT
jgi:hypothetical protein